MYRPYILLQTREWVLAKNIKHKLGQENIPGEIRIPEGRRSEIDRPSILSRESES